MNLSDSYPPASSAASLHPNTVRTQLERLLLSEQLADAPRLKRFLQYIVEESLAGHHDRLKGYTLAVEVFDRPADFDSLTDTIVRVQAGQLRRRLDLYYAKEGRNDPLRIDVPKGGYAPVFELRLEEDAVHASMPATREEIAPAHSVPSIAVLPFANASGNPADQYFADGLTLQTIANLARFKHLLVFSRWTTAGMAGEGSDAARLCDELGAGFVVEGGIRKSPSTIRVTFQLTETVTGTVICSEQLERSFALESLFAIQDEIALMVASRIADRYGPLGRHLERSHRQGQSRQWETYFWITRFYGYHDNHDPALHLQIRNGLTEALTNDPDSSDGWAALSILRLDEHRFHLNERPPDSPLDAALLHGLKAVAVDPENAFAHQALAMAHFYRHEDDEFRIAAQCALELNPGHADALADIGLCYSSLGDFDQGLPLMNRAIKLSPVHPGWYRYPSAWQFAAWGDFAAALAEIKMAPTLGWFWYHAFHAWFSSGVGNEAEAAKAVAALLMLLPTFPAEARRRLTSLRFHDALLEKAVVGWRKAGLEIAD